MTWTWTYIDKVTIEVQNPEGTIVTELAWEDYKPADTTANGWTYSGKYPQAVFDVVAENDVTAALTENIEQTQS